MIRTEWRNAWRIVREHREFLEAMRLAELRSALSAHDARKGKQANG